MNRQPLIALTADFEDPLGQAAPLPGAFSAYPYYALRTNYAGSLAQAGGVPLMLPHLPSQVQRYADMIDGLVVTGGDFDIPPALYGQGKQHSSVITKPLRTEFEWALTEAVLRQNKPVLGICAGEQLLAVIFKGGSLIQHIPDEVPNALTHKQSERHLSAHSVDIVPNTLLHRLVGCNQMQVNSHHHQAVQRVAGGLIVNAIAPDGVIEGVEHPDYRFCLGVQWHPEFAITPSDKAIIQGFVRACAEST